VVGYDLDLERDPALTFRVRFPDGFEMHVLPEEGRWEDLCHQGQSSEAEYEEEAPRDLEVVKAGSRRGGLPPLTRSRSTPYKST
jgi:hypothetical protein